MLGTAMWLVGNDRTEGVTLDAGGALQSRMAAAVDCEQVLHELLHTGTTRSNSADRVNSACLGREYGRLLGT